MKRTMIVIATLAVFHGALFAGVVGYAAGHGWLARDRVRRALAAMKGEEAEVGRGPTTMKAAEPVGADRPAPPALSAEVERIELDRRRREIQDGWEMLERQQLAFVQAREAFEMQKRRHAEALERRARESGTSGSQKELEILAGLKAKSAKELMKLKPDADVVRILSSMDAQKARKIVSECKSGEDRLWIGRILEQLHERNAAQAEVLGAGT